MSYHLSEIAQVSARPCRSFPGMRTTRVVTLSQLPPQAVIWSAHYHWISTSPTCISCELLAPGSGVHPKAHQLWHGPNWKIILKKGNFDRKKNHQSVQLPPTTKRITETNNKLKVLIYIFKVQTRKKRTFLWWLMADTKHKGNSQNNLLGQLFSYF